MCLHPPGDEWSSSSASEYPSPSSYFAHCYASFTMSTKRHSRGTLTAGMPGHWASTLRPCWRRDAHRGGQQWEPATSPEAVTDGVTRLRCDAQVSADRRNVEIGCSSG